MPHVKTMHPTPAPKFATGSETVAAKRLNPGEFSYVARLGLKSSDIFAVQKEIKRGFPFAVLRRIQHEYSFSFEELADALHVSPRTLVRRKETGRLGPLESDRALRLSRVYTKAVDLYEGNEGAALAWLKRKNRALGGLPPIDLIKTETGAIQVEQLIGRLEYGVYS